jgi:hypothetical protein
VFACVGKQGNEASLLDSFCYHTLVLCACAGLAARADLSIFGDILSEQIGLLVIDRQGFVRAELTEFWLGKESALTAAFSASLVVSSIVSHLLLQFLFKCSNRSLFLLHDN